MANHLVCYVCGGDGKSDELHRCVHCEFLQHTHCHSLFSILRRFALCDHCLKQPVGTGRWVWTLAAINFSDECEHCSFCTCCAKLFCDHCCPVTELHQHDQHSTEIVQVIRRNSRLLIRLEDVNKFYQCADIQPETPDYVPLYPPIQEAPLDGKKSCGFGDCNREINEPYEYCSIECKFKKETRDETETCSPVSDLLDPKFVKVHRPNIFCITCCVAFNSDVCDHHWIHKDLRIVEVEGCLCVTLLPVWEPEWNDSLSDVQSISAPREGECEPNLLMRTVPLRPPSCHPGPGQLLGRCECGTPIVENMKYCSVLCKALYGDQMDVVLQGNKHGLE